MQELDDTELLRQYTENDSEEAFGAIVSRHINKVYSVALRQTGNAHQAEEITQAVFVIFAKKAHGLSNRVILSGWLYQTARLASATFLRSEIRRARREQEAHTMQSILNEPALDETWKQMCPLLDEAMAKLNETDRNAMLLRFFDGKSIKEVGVALGTTEDTAKKRVSRALEKLQRFFNKRGVVSTTAIIAGTISSNSVQAAPATLAKAVTALAISKGAVTSASTLTLAKGALKVMAWTKTQTAIIAGIAAILVIGTTTSTVIFAERNSNQQRLKDGSVLSISQVSFGETHDIVIGNKTNHWSWPGHEELIVEFKLSGKNATSNSFVKPVFFQSARCMLYGEKGIEFAEEISPDGFKKSGKDYYGEFQTEIIPRDSHYLWLRIDESPTKRPDCEWQTVAKFKISNPAPATNYNWTANATPITNTVNGMNFIVRDVTLTTNSADKQRIWNHEVSIMTEVWTNGVQLTNWSPAYINAGDASGNHVGYFQTHRSLDPRYVWKLDMDFEMASNFPVENVCTVALPRRQSASITTNIMGAPVTIGWWDGQYVEADMPTNYLNLALKFISVADRQGNVGAMPSGSWNQHHFNEGYFMVQKNGIYSQMDRPATVTFAVVPNVQSTFYVQPRLLPPQ